MSFNPARRVLEQSRRTPDGLALAGDGVSLVYADLVRRASRLAAALRAAGAGPGACIGILGSRSLAALEAVLAVLWAGAAYVPLGLRWPAERLRSVLELQPLHAIVADEAGAALLAPVAGAASALFVQRREHAQPSRIGRHPRVVCIEELPPPDGAGEPARLDADDLAYVIFTSGTTGVPKGVMVSAGALAAYLDALALRKAMTPEDRASQFTELTFDPAVGEIFVPWWAGASLHLVPPLGRMSPARFIAQARLTVWGSTPALIAWMRDTRTLKPGSLPGLRYSSFGGEPLPLASVRTWQAAAPNSAIDNLYGPTEATVDCAGQRIEPGAIPVVTPGRDIVAIGVPHPGSEIRIVDAGLHPLPDGTPGEIAIAGRQLSLGYLGEPELTARRFPVRDGKRWYLTGDLGMRDAAGMLHHLGRLDHQIKLHGHRVELEEVEAHARAAAGTAQVAAVACPVRDGVAQGIVCFVAGGGVDGKRLRAALRERMPHYMVPDSVREIDALPLGTSGKADRNALVARLEEEGKNPDAGGTG